MLQHTDLRLQWSLRISNRFGFIVLVRPSSCRALDKETFAEWYSCGLPFRSLAKKLTPLCPALSFALSCSTCCWACGSKSTPSCIPRHEALFSAIALTVVISLLFGPIPLFLAFFDLLLRLCDFLRLRIRDSETNSVLLLRPLFALT